MCKILGHSDTRETKPSHFSDPRVTTSSISFPRIGAISSPSTAAHPSERNSVLPTAPPIDRAAKPHTATHSYNDLSSPVEHRALIIAGDLVQK